MFYYKCDDCKKRFFKTESTEVCMEEIYGVGDMFSNWHYEKIACCPHCKSTDIESKSYYFEDDERLTEDEKIELESIEYEEDLFYEILERGLI